MRNKVEGYSLRFPDGLRERIKKVAEANKRSLNSEIIATLQIAYPHEKDEIRNAIRTLDLQIERETDKEKQQRMLKARNNLTVELFYQPLDFDEYHRPYEENFEDEEEK